MINYVKEKLGYRHYFQVELLFVKDDDIIGRIHNQEIICSDKSSILSRRFVATYRDITDNEYLQKTIYRNKVLHGCKIQFKVIAYIGCFRNKGL
ncbi:MAG: hypothetical protein ACPG9K_01010 [Poseidonibacter sp.]